MNTRSDNGPAAARRTRRLLLAFYLAPLLALADVLLNTVWAGSPRSPLRDLAPEHLAGVLLFACLYAMLRLALRVAARRFPSVAEKAPRIASSALLLVLTIHVLRRWAAGSFGAGLLTLPAFGALLILALLLIAVIEAPAALTCPAANRNRFRLVLAAPLLLAALIVGTHLAEREPSFYPYIDAGPRRAAAAPAGAPELNPRRVVLLTVDTLRRDALGVYNAAAPPTPALDALAAQSIVFDHAVSPAPWTLPAFASILTGVSPDVHRAVHFTRRLPDAFDTLAERFRAAGCLTAAIGTNPFLTPTYNLHQGFDTYAMFPQPTGRSLGAGLLRLAAPRRFDGTADTAELTDLAVEWLDLHHGRPFFLWLHYFDPHLPYAPPTEYLPKQPPPPGMTASFSEARLDAIRTGYFRPTPEQVRWIRTLYDAEVRHVDAHIARVLAALKRLGLDDDTLIIFASDHGEEFWEHGGFEHGHTVYDELLRVPLFVRLPGAGLHRRVDQPVSTTALTPTILDLCAIPADPSAFSVASIAPLLREDPAVLPAVPIVSTGCLYYEGKTAVRFDGLKFIQTDLSLREELFDLRSDPAERLSVLASHPADRTQALRHLAADQRDAETLRARFPGLDLQAAELTGDLIEGLRALGYVE